MTPNARRLEEGRDRKWMNGIFDEVSFRMVGAEELLIELITDREHRLHCATVFSVFLRIWIFRNQPLTLPTEALIRSPGFDFRLKPFVFHFLSSLFHTEM